MAAARSAAAVHCLGLPAMELAQIGSHPKLFERRTLDPGTGAERVYTRGGPRDCAAWPVIVDAAAGEGEEDVVALAFTEVSTEAPVE